jgi:hypothetical protein
MAVNVIHILRISTQNIERGHYTLGSKYVKESNYPNPRTTRNQETKDRKISTKNINNKESK